MDPTGISLKNSGDKYIELEKLIRKEYEKCYTKNKSTIISAPISSNDSNDSGSKAAVVTKEETTKLKITNEQYPTNINDNLELKLPPDTSEKPFAWFYDWVTVVEESPGRYAADKKRAEDLRGGFNERCQNAYSNSQKDKALIDRWCNITEWKEFKLDSSALHDDEFKKRLEKMKKQIGYSEAAYNKYGERDVKNAFDRSKGSSFNYQMKNVEQKKVLPYFSGVSVALGNIKAANIAMRGLDEQIVAKRIKEYQAELGMKKKKRIEEKKKQVQREKDKLYSKQKPLADAMIEDICNLAKEDAVNLREALPGQYKAQAEKLDLIDGLEEVIAEKYAKCYDAELISLTCNAAAEDYMRCRNVGPPSKYVSLASSKKTIHDFKAEYKKCHEGRKRLYAREKNKREKSSKNILKYIEIYRERGGYFINDYNECVDSIISVTKKLSRKKRLAVISNSDVRSCEDESSLLDKYATNSCSCNYGVVVDTLSESRFTEFSDDILALIKSSHSNIGNKKASRIDKVGLKNSLLHPEASTALFTKIGLECER